MKRTKTPPRYLVRAHIEIDGKVKESDVVGAIFGQTGEILEKDLNLRDLQENGKIGRINVSLKKSEDGTEGWISVPTGLQRKKTAQIGAALETVDKVGTYNAEVEIDGIKGARKAKRKYLQERAQELVEQIEEKEINTVKSEAISTRFELGKLSNILKDLKGSMKSVLLDEELNEIKESEVKNIRKEIKDLDKTKAVVFDGVITQTLADLAQEEGVEYLVGMQKRLKKEPEDVKVFTPDDLSLRKDDTEK